ncbi:ABC transporter permease subunit [Lentibacillus cibarius]|uniref:ABC transporter permease subunit n=2 Tax=Lentibacillus cibarius TaxID=2583219 RepID=A0A5S3QRH9_9BACI|nr:ABC transporter permease subunit [Lentibacillus cibarius]
MLKNSFYADDGETLSFIQYLTVIKSNFYLKSILNSVIISLVSALIGIIIAVICSYSITRFSEKVQDRLLTVCNVFSNFEGVPLGFSAIILLGNSGLFILFFEMLGLEAFAQFDLYTWGGMILVYVFFQTPISILLLYPTYYGMREEWRESALLLGASNASYWKHIGIPILLPSIVGILSILFGNAMGAYATAYAMVGSTYNLMSLQISALIAGDVVLKPELGSAMGVYLAVITILAMMINEKMMRKVRRDLE